MPASYTVDVVGSQYTKGIFASLLDRADRVAIVEELEGDQSDYVETAATLVAGEGLYHPLDSTLACQRIAMRKFGSNRARAVMQYFRRRLDNQTSSNLLARYRGGPVWPTQWYDQPTTWTAGKPSGLALYGAGKATDAFAKPLAWTWRRNAVEIYMPTTLTSNPSGSVFDLLDNVNSVQCSMAGYIFDAGEILFNNYTVDHRLENDVDRFDVWYKFTAMPRRFTEQYAWWDSDADPQTWKISERVPFDSANFIGAFPFANGGIT